MGEHLLCTEGVRSSSLLISTILFRCRYRLLPDRGQAAAGDDCVCTLPDEERDEEAASMLTFWVLAWERESRKRGDTGMRRRGRPRVDVCNRDEGRRVDA